MVVYRLVGRDVRAAGGVSIDTAQPVRGVTLRLRLVLVWSAPPLLSADCGIRHGQTRTADRDGIPSTEV